MPKKGSRSESTQNRNYGLTATSREARVGRTQRRVAASHAEIDDPRPPLVDMRNPASWAKLEDADAHLITSLSTSIGDSYEFCGSARSLHKIYVEHISKNARVKGCIDRAGFSAFCLFDEKKLDQRLAFSLVERWWDTTHTFHLPYVELGFTPYDFTCLTGIPVGTGFPTPPFDSVNWNSHETVRLLFPFIEEDDFDGSFIRCAYFRRVCTETDLMVVADPNAIPDEPSREVEKMVIRAFFLLLIGDVLFPIGKRKVALGWLASVVDVGTFGRQDWGGAVLARMYTGMDNMSRQRLKKGEFCWIPLVVCHFTLLV